MPKKLGTNPKAQAARERKQEQKNQVNASKEKQKEDALWQDEDKQLAKKQQRKDQKESKRLESLQKKQENKLLLEAETTTLAGGCKKPTPAKKVTRADIDNEKVKQAKLKEKEEKMAVKAEVEDSAVIEENPNQKMAEMLAEQDGVEARSISDAIAVLSVGEVKVDRNPEKRMKAAFAEFEQRELPILKAENTNLRLSQLKQMLRKKWQSSPDNPMNNL